jgi:hypothetical protein
VILADGTHWASGATAIGTVAVAVVAVGVAILSQRHSDRQIREEREHSDEVVAEERRLANQRLAEQMRVENSQVLTQLEQSRDQFRELREKEQDAEQIAEAYAVQIVPVRMSPESYGTRVATDPETAITCPGVIVINRGRYTITRLEAQICLNGNSMTHYDKREHFSTWWNLRNMPLAEGLDGPEPDVRLDTLTPSDLGMRFTHDAIAESRVRGSYPVVRWKDRWGQTWEHKLGRVEKIGDDTQWTG